ncbi:MAG: hypothetical protein PQJ59_12000 [Spirochaetales bacterium]|nr:hypothetical protein [Spirochaetales bacterium]
MVYNVKDHDIGDTIGMAFRLTWGSIKPYLKYVLILTLFMVLILGVIAGILGLTVGFTQAGTFMMDAFDNADEEYLTVLLIMGGFFLVLFPLFYFYLGLLHIMYTRRVSDLYLGIGNNASLKEDLAGGFGRLLPFLGASILIGFGVMGGSLLLIVPGIIFSMAWGVYVEILVLEGTTVMESLRRSWDLTRKNRLRILGAYMVTAVIYYMVYGVISLISLLPAMLGVAGQVIAFILNIIPSLLYQGVMINLSLVIYYNLRVQKEGFAPGADQLSREFSKPLEGPDA